MTDDLDVARHEVFGPVLSVLTFTDEDEVVARANALPLSACAAYVAHPDLARAHRVARALEVGTVTVNGFPSNAPNLPSAGSSRAASAAKAAQKASPSSGAPRTS